MAKVKKIMKNPGALQSTRGGSAAYSAEALAAKAGSPLARRSSAEAAKTIWKFVRWDLVDLSRFTVKLKAEFQGSNRDIYRPEAIVGSSAK